MILISLEIIIEAIKKLPYITILFHQNDIGRINLYKMVLCHILNITIRPRIPDLME